MTRPCEEFSPAIVLTVRRPSHYHERKAVLEVAYIETEMTNEISRRVTTIVKTGTNIRLVASDLYNT